MYRFICIVVIAAFLASGCGGNEAELIDYEPVADDNPFLADTGYKKPEITPDGVMDEAVWAAAPAFAFGSELTATVKAFYGENGVYFGAAVEDPDLWASGSVVYDNSSFEVYLDTSGEGGAQPESAQWEIFIDVTENSLTRQGAGGLWVESALIKSYGVTADGSIGDDAADRGYTVELFIPYAGLGGVPATDLGIAFGIVGCQDGARQTWSGVSNVNVSVPDTYYRFYRDNNSIEEPRKVNYAKLALDGVRGESAWAGRSAYRYGDGGRADVTGLFADEGLYFFFDVKDDKAVSEGGSAYLNDSVEVYLDVKGDGGRLPRPDDVQIRADTAGNVEFLRGTGSFWESARNNALAGCKPGGGGYAIELFVPWSDLGLQGAPDAIKASFGAVDWDGKYNDAGGRAINWSGIGSDPQAPSNYIALTRNGVSGASQASVPAPIALDGVSGESLWAGKPSYTFSQGGMITVTWAFDAAGLCLFFNATDADVWAASDKIHQNDGVEIYLDTLGNGGEAPQADDHQIRADAAGNTECLRGNGGGWSPAGYAARAATRVLGDLNGGSADIGYNVEVFIAWSDMGLQGAPAALKVSFGAPRADAGAFAGWSGIGSDPQVPNTYRLLTPDGIS